DAASAATIDAAARTPNGRRRVRAFADDCRTVSWRLGERIMDFLLMTSFRVRSDVRVGLVSSMDVSTDPIPGNLVGSLRRRLASDREHQEARHREKSSQHDQTRLEATCLILEIAN